MCVILSYDNFDIVGVILDSDFIKLDTRHITIAEILMASNMQLVMFLLFFWLVLLFREG